MDKLNVKMDTNAAMTIVTGFCLVGLILNSIITNSENISVTVNEKSSIDISTKNQKEIETKK